MRNPFSRKTAEAEGQGVSKEPAPGTGSDKPTIPEQTLASEKSSSGSGQKHPPSSAADLPPSYSDSVGRPGPRTAASTLAVTSTPQQPQRQQQQPQQQLQPQQLPPQQQQQQPRYYLPTEWCLYGGGFMETTLMLAEDPSRPVYAVSQHSGWSGQPDVILHCGPDPRMPALASATGPTFGATGSSMGANAIVLPALHPFPTDRSGNGGMAVVTEELVNQAGWTPNMLFSIEVGHPAPFSDHAPPPQREMFEWRHSRGDAVHDLDTGASYGYKLVRLSTAPPPGVDPGAAQFVGGGYMSNKGEEVVAVFARMVGSISRRMRFRFLGTGASGLLGDRWALMAAVSAIRIWQRDTRSRR
ncbi:PAX-interacting protein 1 [Microdochium nivale]|nr:PAX-interacting protein 1 [Microdochium nivale]